MRKLVTSFLMTINGVIGNAHEWAAGVAPWRFGAGASLNSTKTRSRRGRSCGGD